MIKGLAHVCLIAPDLKQALKFYCECLGFTKHFDFLKDGKQVGFYLQLADGAFVEIFLSDAMPSADAPQIIKHFCLEVDDLDVVTQRLRSFGYPASEKKLGADQSWQMWTTDPAGVKIEFHQYTPASSQHTRRDCVLSR